MGSAVVTRSAEDIRHDVEQAIRDHVARFLDSHGGAVDVARVTEEGDVHLSFRGACRACPAAAATVHSKVEPALLAVPGVRAVVAPNSNISAIAVRRIQAMSLRRPTQSWDPGEGAPA